MRGFHGCWCAQLVAFGAGRCSQLMVLGVAPGWSRWSPKALRIGCLVEKCADWYGACWEVSAGASLLRHGYRTPLKCCTTQIHLSAGSESPPKAVGLAYSRHSYTRGGLEVSVCFEQLPNSNSLRTTANRKEMIGHPMPTEWWPGTLDESILYH